MNPKTPNDARQRRIPHKRRLLCAAISLSLTPLATPSFAQEQEIEEVVVTGSFIRRSEGFSQASSVTQVSAEDLIDTGTLNMGEVIQNLSFVNGSASATTNTIQGTSSLSNSVDLRGLGASSTLTLLDGKRVVDENLNNMIPTIAIQRLDIVADGAAALYGNEAVAGVVNFIPYKSYDGFKLDTFTERDSRGDYEEHSVQALWGEQIGPLDVVLAGQFRTNSRLAWDERNKLTNSGLVLSGNAPGNWYVPDRDASGQYTGDRSSAIDPNCGSRTERTDYVEGANNNPFGAALGANCYFDFGDTRSFREPQDITQYFSNVTWDVTDDLTLSLQGYRTKYHSMTYTSTSNPGDSRVPELPTVRGEMPGNPFRAVNASNQPLFGFDANGDGVPDRGTVDVNNDGRMDALVAGTTGGPGLIPLYEDVQARSLRPINKTHTPSDGHTTDMDNLGSYTDRVSRYSFQADFAVPFIEGWEGMAAYTYGEANLKFMSNQNYDIEAMKQGLNCDVVNDREACYNPFFVVDQSTNNTVHVMNAVAGRSYEYTRDTLATVDIVLNGELPIPGGFELPGGVIGAAVGYQNRASSYRNTPSLQEIRGDTFIGTAATEAVTSGSRDVDAYFVELAIPLLPSVEIEAAVRREEFSTGQESTDPKIGATWQATDWLTLRATRGEAFIAPSLEQLLNPVTCGLDEITDPFGPHSGFTVACGGGNPTLENESAESKQLGIDLEFDNFDFHVTWNETDFANRIVGTSGQQIVNADFQDFKAATGFAGDGTVGNRPSAAQLTSWVNSGASDPSIIRDPNNIQSILRVDNTGSVNAERVKVTAYDIVANYHFGFNDWGDFRIGLQATYLDEFLFQANADEDIVDGVGMQNDATGAAPALPEWKANLTLGWSRGSHSVVSIVHYVDDMIYDGPTFSHIDFFSGTYRPANIVDTGIKAWTDMDIAYTYRGLELFDGEMALSIGSRNVFDREAQRTPQLAGVLGELQDPMGRSIYARLVYDF